MATILIMLEIIKSRDMKIRKKFRKRFEFFGILSQKNVQNFEISSFNCRILCL